MSTDFFASHRSPAPFLPSLEGLRAVACCGIIVTHVAFQTGADTGSIINRFMARTDFFVPVFFALSGFLLWRRHKSDFAMPLSRAELWQWLGYYVKRVGRIVPASAVLVLLVVTLFPVAGRPSLGVIAANLTLTQIYVPQGLVGGLTHLWSLCVEMAFYLLLPVFSLLIGRRRRGVRVGCVVAVALLSFGWAFLPPFQGAHDPGSLNPHVLPPAFAAWFAVGMVAAEVEEFQRSNPASTWSKCAPRVFGRWRVAWCLLACAALCIAALDGPEGLSHAEPAEFSRRMVYGTVFAAALLMPYVFSPRSAVLESRVMQTLGRWSYSIFLWHMSVLSLVFPLLGLELFSGYTALVLLVTFLATVPVAALSYALVEEPARQFLARWWAGVRSR